MKKNLGKLVPAALAFVLIVGLSASFFSAQAETGESQPAKETTMRVQVRDGMEVLQADIETVRKAAIANALEMTEKESEAFWPVYNEYQKNLGVVRERQTTLMTNYLTNLGDISDEQAKEMLRELMSIKESDIRTKKAYVPQFLQVLPPKKVVRLYQVENRLDAAFTFELTKEIPLMW
ncbi:MAG: hypothetical protein Kow0099_22640 [Candidatus Abyssubacteria bacterium]